MRLFQAPLDTSLDSTFSATLSVHGLHFTVCAPSKYSGEAKSPGARGVPACGIILTPKPPTVRESHGPGPPLEPGPLPFPPFPKEVPAGRGVPPRRGGSKARRGLGVPARGVLRPVRGQEVWEYHEPGTPHKPGPLYRFPQMRKRSRTPSFGRRFCH